MIVIIDRRRPPVVLSPVDGPRFVHPVRIAGFANPTRHGEPLRIWRPHRQNHYLLLYALLHFSGFGSAATADASAAENSAGNRQSQKFGQADHLLSLPKRAPSL